MISSLQIKLISYAGLLFLFSVVYGQELPDEIESTLNNIGTKMVQLTLDGDYLSLMDYYDDDVIVMPDFQPAIKSKKALTNRYKEDMKKGIKHHSFTGSIEKRWQKGDEIFERGTFGMAVSSNVSSKPAAYYGSYFQIWKRQSDGSYKISFIIWNLDFNPYE